MIENPFKPGFATRPPVLAGRDTLIAELTQPFVLKGHTPWRYLGLQGLRGVGKTAIAMEVGDIAGDAGWAVNSILIGEPEPLALTLGRNLLDITKLPRALRKTFPGDTNAATSTTHEANVAGVYKVSHRRDSATPPLGTGLGAQSTTWFKAALRHLSTTGQDVLLILDEAHLGDKQELRSLGTIMSAMADPDEEGRLGVMFVGLQGLQDHLIDAMSFSSERLRFRNVGNLSDLESKDGLLRPMRAIGLEVNVEALNLLAAASGGYPYFIALLGHHAVNTATNMTITTATATAAITAATDDIAALYRGRLARLSPTHRTVMAAAAELSKDGLPIATKDLAAALGYTQSQLSQPRARLIAAGQLIAAGRGLLDEPVPGLLHHIRTSGFDRAEPTQHRRPPSQGPSR